MLNITKHTPKDEIINECVTSMQEKVLALKELDDDYLVQAVVDVILANCRLIQSQLNITKQ